MQQSGNLTCRGVGVGHHKIGQANSVIEWNERHVRFQSQKWSRWYCADWKKMSVLAHLWHLSSCLLVVIVRQEKNINVSENTYIQMLTCFRLFNGWELLKNIISTLILKNEDNFYYWLLKKIRRFQKKTLYLGFFIGLPVRTAKQASFRKIFIKWQGACQEVC